MNNYFCGWYYRCQSKDHTLAFIPAVHMGKGAGSASLQIIRDGERWIIPLPYGQTRIRADKPCAVLGTNVFREDGIRLDVHTDNVSAVGELRFDALSPIRYDIMGPFRYVPFMECRHSVFSMQHKVNGWISINGTNDFVQDGRGYIEGDRGRSFPKRYAWTQCSFEGGSLMLSVAEIPLGPIRFTGVISVIQLYGKEYRLATYLGAKAVRIGNGRIVIKQGDFCLTATLLDKSACVLRAPIDGAMTRLVRENVACRARYRFSKGDRILV